MNRRQAVTTGTKGSLEKLGSYILYILVVLFRKIWNEWNTYVAYIWVSTLSSEWSQGWKPVFGMMIQFERKSPRSGFTVAPVWKPGKLMWLDQSGVWWAVRAWLVLNHWLDYDFLFTGACIFRMFVFKAEAVSHLCFILVFKSTDMQDRWLDTEADIHTQMI